MERSDQIAELVQAFTQAQAKMKNPQFDSQNPHFRTRYASLAAVRDAVTGPLTEHGLSITQLVSTNAEQAVCQTVLWHSSGQFLSTSLAIPVSKPDAQGYGSAMTYARRYALMALCNVAGDEDDVDTGKPQPEQKTYTRPQYTNTPHADDGERQPLIDQISAYHRQDHDQEWIDRYWGKMRRRFHLVAGVAFPVEALKILLVEVREYYGPTLDHNGLLGSDRLEPAAAKQEVLP